MKAVLISIQPKWCELIANGKKTVEVRKTKPKLETPFKVYIYCTKGRGDCLWRWDGGIWYDTQFPNERPNRIDGKVIGEFVCDKIYGFVQYGFGIAIINEQYEIVEPQDMCNWSYLTEQQLIDYFENKDGYGWHISNLVIYDKPKELSEFHKPIMPTGLRYENDTITRPPQSWCYVESEVQGE